ncbi:pro-sigmaK processing inhibitor BofA [Paenibacillus sp. 1011MAR3C5]|uniref:pro-sigmaK processing inhibitor BofA family protein n=1 Tax=Paenibacillus sp. 1011MAR3C5 TaxID=1675787 RepID=UPI000E6C3006|nr:pro-sigmaK processing inhibitor BofA family protein [Paenibacillus sp. 1011MAR3C5]RJE85996.1 pro-sigmaK processing inhibitor BofA [Paenibacillus sp. 1011MAR3C5]
MKIVWLSILIISSLLLVGILLRNKLSWGWLKGFALHIVIAAGLLYLVNELAIVEGLHIPLNPITISTAVVLGVPGVLMMAGVQLFIV